MYAVLTYALSLLECMESTVANAISLPESQLASAWFQDDLVFAVGGCQLPRDLLRAVGAVVVNDNHLPCELTTLSHHEYWRRGETKTKKK